MHRFLVFSLILLGCILVFGAAVNLAVAQDNPTKPAGDTGDTGIEAVGYAYPSPLNVVETITDLGGGQWRYSYSFVNIDSVSIWHFGVWTNFNVGIGTETTFAEVADTWFASGADIDSHLPEYDARNLDPNIVWLSNTWDSPYPNSPNPITPGTSVSGFSFVGSVYDPNPKYYFYEKLGDWLVNGNVTAVGLTGSGSFPGRGDDVTTSLGLFKILVYEPFWPMMAGYPGYDPGNHILTSPTLYDPATVIGRSDPHMDGSISDTGGTPVGTAGTIVSDGHFAVRPPFFEGPPGTREVHTEIRGLNLVGGGAAVRAGTSLGLPLSPGEVESKSGPGEVGSKSGPSGDPNQDFPAESFFDVFVEVDLPGLGGFPTGTLFNLEPLLVSDDNLSMFPPWVGEIYVVINKTAVPVFFRDDNPGLWKAGDLFGWLILVGHGVGLGPGDVVKLKEVLNATPPVPVGFPPAGDDVTTSMGMSRILVSDDFRPIMAGYPGYDGISRVTSPLLFDWLTIIGRSDPHRDGSIPDTGGTPVGTAGTIVSDGDFPVRPPFFEGPPGTREVHTEVRKLNLVGGGAAVRAGTGLDLPLSPGEVESKSGASGDPTLDFPAESFFDVFVEINLDELGEIHTATLFNTDPLLVGNNHLEKFPPKVICIHRNDCAVPVYFKFNHPNGLWKAGDRFGWLVVFCHGISFNPDCPFDVDEFVEVFYGVPEMPICVECIMDALCEGWNMLSFPGEPVPNAVEDIIADTPVLPFFYTYDVDAGYYLVDTVESGKGYWAACMEPYELNICYTPSTSVDVPMDAGWNMVGSVDCVVPVESLTSSPPNHLPPIYSYDRDLGGYVQVTELLPGIGHWAAATAPCTLTIECGPPPSPIAQNAVDLAEPVWEGTLTVQSQGQQQELMFGVHTSATAGIDTPIDKPLPPPAPTTSAEGGKRKEKGILKAGWLTAHPDFPILGASYVGINDQLVWTLSVDLAKPGKLVVGDLPDGFNCIMTEDGKSIVNNKGAMHLSAGEHEITLVLEPVSDKPKKTQVLANYPNPFNPETWIPYQLAEDTDISIKIYDVSAKLIRTLNLGHKPAGFYTSKPKAAYWDGKNEAGEPVASGVYFYTIQAGEFTATKKMILAK